MQKSNDSRNKRKERLGIVKSNSMNKTITVVVDKVINHPVYNKLVRSHTTFKAHDEKNEAKIGQDPGDAAHLKDEAVETGGNY